MKTCEFCGQEHPVAAPITVAGGTFPVTECPNLPKGWVAVGPDAADGSLVITDVDAPQAAVTTSSNEETP